MEREIFSDVWEQLGIKDPGKIIIPGATYLYEGKQYRDPDEEIDVSVADLNWLTSSERTWEEVDRVLEGHLQGIEQSLKNKGPESPLAKRYGIEEEVSAPASRILAYATLLDTHSLMEVAHSIRIGELKEEFEEEKAKIDQGSGGRFKKDKKKRELFQQKYKPRRDRSSVEIAKERRLQELILRKAVMDIFSPNEESKLPLSTLPRIMPEFQKEDGSLPSEVASLIDRLTDYLQTTDDKSLFDRYHYKKSKGIVRTSEDTKVLRDSLRSALDPEILGLSPELQERFSRLGKSYFVFLRNRVLHREKVPGLDQYPRLSLLYDTLTSAFSSKNTNVIQKSGTSIVEKYFEDMSTGFGIGAEVDRAAKQLEQSYTPVVEWADKMSIPRIKKWEEVITFLNVHEIPNVIKELYLTDEFRIYSGFICLTTYLNKISSDRIVEQFDAPEVLRDRISRALRNYIPQEKAIQRIKVDMLRNIVLNLPIHLYLHSHDITEDLMVYSNAHLLSSRDSGKVKHTRYYPEGAKEENLFKMWRFLEKESTSANSRAKYLRLNINHFWGKERKKIKTIEGQNANLKGDIQNRSVWFVAPIRGDRFSSGRDIELGAKGIKSVQFNIDRTRPREHKVTINFEEGVETYEFWLDQEGILRSETGVLQSLDTATNQILTNLILKRLWFITSGELSKYTDAESSGIVEDESPVFVWRRAHYRIYGVGGRKFTNEHAEEIKSTYGIDLANENRRRQKIGVLLPNQYMTFVSEVIPDNWTEEMKVAPNELPFDPAWVPVKI